MTTEDSVMVTAFPADVTETPTNGSFSDGDPDERFDRYIWIYTLPVIFVIGVTGNVLTIVVMRRKRMRGTATSVYLTLLAVADTSVLVTGLIPEWLIQTDIKDISEVGPWLCKIERFLFYTTGDVAVWILVAFTCDRCVAVCLPLKKRRLCTARRAYLSCLIVVLVAFVKNLHVFWTRGAIYDDEGRLVENCGKPEPYVYFEKNVRPWIVMVAVSLGPFLVILVCNAIIVRRLVWSGRMGGASGPRADGRAPGSEREGKQRAFTQTTAMCLSTSFAFLVLITPSIVLLIGKPNWTSDDRPNLAYDVAKAINNQLMFVNHSINFFLYCLTGARFRAEFVSVFDGCPRRIGGADGGACADDRRANHQQASGSTLINLSSLSTDSVVTSKYDLQANGDFTPCAKDRQRAPEQTTNT